MLRKWLPLFTMLIFCLTVMVASAGSPHFIGTVGFRSGSLHATGDLAGLGNTNVTVRMDAYATVIALCQNNGGNQAPGRNPIRVTTVVTDVETPDRNGRATVELVAEDPLTLATPPPSPSPKTAGCPNGNWTVIGFMPGSTQWTGATISVIDNLTHVVLLRNNYTCTGSGATLSCVRS